MGLQFPAAASSFQGLEAAGGASWWGRFPDAPAKLEGSLASFLGRLDEKQ